MVEAIRVENLVKVFVDKKERREITACDHISFSVARGEVFGFLGPNGAGKTTTARILAGLLRPNSGGGQVLGYDILAEPGEIRKRIGFLTENHGNYENLTVEQNLEFFASFYGLQGQALDQRMGEVLDQLELADRRKQKAGKLSKGLKQRLALARVIIHEPGLLFLDEPTAALDPVAAVQVRELILSLKAKDRTIFINSHNLEEVQKVCDKVGIIDRGKLKRVGSPDDIGDQLFDTQVVRCRLKQAPPGETVHELAGLEGMLDVKQAGSSVLLFTSNSEAVTPEIVRVLARSGADVLEVSRQQHTLEEIYLKLMQDGGGEA